MPQIYLVGENSQAVKTQIEALEKKRKESLIQDIKDSLQRLEDLEKSEEKNLALIEKQRITDEKAKKEALLKEIPDRPSNLIIVTSKSALGMGMHKLRQTDAIVICPSSQEDLDQNINIDLSMGIREDFPSLPQLVVRPNELSVEPSVDIPAENIFTQENPKGVIDKVEDIVTQKRILQQKAQQKKAQQKTPPIEKPTRFGFLMKTLRNILGIPSSPTSSTSSIISSVGGFIRKTFQRRTAPPVRKPTTPVAPPPVEPPKPEMERIVIVGPNRGEAYTEMGGQSKEGLLPTTSLKKGEQTYQLVEYDHQVYKGAPAKAYRRASTIVVYPEASDMKNWVEDIRRYTNESNQRIIVVKPTADPHQELPSNLQKNVTILEPGALRSFEDLEKIMQKKPKEEEVNRPTLRI